MATVNATLRFVISLNQPCMVTGSAALSSQPIVVPLRASALPTPRAEWVATLPNHKLPDRSDFTRYGRDFSGRVTAWQTAVKESERLRDEFAEWVSSGADVRAVAAL